MWASVRAEGPGFTRIRIVFGSGGFGHGQTAGVAVGAGPSLPGALLPAGLVGAAMGVEAQLRGAVGWWMLFGRHFGVDERELGAVSHLRLHLATVAGVVKSVKPRRLGKFVAVAFAAVFLLPVLFAVLASVLGG